MPNNVSPKPIERKTVRFGVKYGDFVLMYERTVEKIPPAQLKDTDYKQLAEGGIDIYA